MADPQQWKVVRRTKAPDGAASTPVAGPFATMLDAEHWIDTHSEAEADLSVAKEHSRQKNDDPSPEEIAAACNHIRANWSKSETWRRTGIKPTRVELTPVLDGKRRVDNGKTQPLS